MLIICISFLLLVFLKYFTLFNDILLYHASNEFLSQIQNILFYPYVKYKEGLFAGTVPANKKHLTGTVPANKEHLTGTVPVNKEHLTGTLYIFWGNEGEMLIAIYLLP